MEIHLTGTSETRDLPRRAQGGFTLLEALVATLILSIAVVGLLSAISTSLNNASRLSDYDQVSMLARRKMEDVLAIPMPLGQPVAGTFTPAETGGFEAGWIAVVQPFEASESGMVSGVLDRVALEVWWQRDGQRRTMQLETFRARRLRNADELGGYPRG